MSKKKIMLAAAAVLVLILAGICFGAFCRIVDGKIYPKNPEQLDLRGKKISAEHYASLRQALPDCEILWDIPFQGSHYPMDTSVLQVSTLTDGDVEAVALFPHLETVDARECRDYPQIALLQQRDPQLAVRCAVKLGTRTYYENAEGIWVSSLSDGEFAAIACLPNLKKAVVNGGVDITNFDRLQEYCHEKGIAFSVNLGSGDIPEDTQSLTVLNATGPQVNLLSLLKNLKTLHLKEPKADMEKITRLMEQLPDTKITWEKTVLGLTFSGVAEEIDLSPVIAKGEDDAARNGMTAWEMGANRYILGTREEQVTTIKVSKYHPLPDKIEQTRSMLAELEEAMPYFPNAEKLILCGARLNNLAVSEFREAHREDFKLVWTVQCGEVAVRTDTKFFMPTKYQVYYFFDEDAYNLRYCEEVECIDIGHMKVHDLSFVRYMPNLKYLVITLSGVRNIEPLASCKNLVFLEMDWTGVKDYSPLLECTALEDLNIGETFGNMEPIYQMTWLKNLWLVGCGKDVYRTALEKLPDTVNIAYNYKNPDDGWRRLPNYYNMRDALLMFYML